MRILILTVIAALGLSVGAANARSLSYTPPAHNYYQNNWMTGRG